MSACTCDSAHLARCEIHGWPSDRALLAQMAATIYASRDGSNVERTAAFSVAAALAILAEIDKEPAR